MSDCAFDSTEDRYVRIMEASRVPVWGLFRESVREDRYLILPRMIRVTLRTLLRVPRSLFMKAGPARESYVFETLTRWAKVVCRIGQVRLEVRGAENVDPGRTYLFAVNHSSPVDIPVLYATLPVRAGFVANGVFSRLPAFSYWMRMSGAVFVEKGSRRAEMTAFRLMVRRLRRGRSLVLFPEGHIHQGEGLDEFKRGGVHSALLAKVPIVPVCLKGTGRVMRSGSLRFKRRERVVIEFGEPIDGGILGRDERRNIDALVRERILSMKG